MSLPEDFDFLARQFWMAKLHAPVLDAMIIFDEVGRLGNFPCVAQRSFGDGLYSMRGTQLIGNSMKRRAYLIAGWTALLLGTLGVILPILPTVPFVLLAAYCFARSSPELERKLVQHPKYGPHIEAWRTRGAISRNGKRGAYAAFSVSAILGITLLQMPLALVPAVVGILGASWVFGRPTT